MAAAAELLIDVSRLLWRLSRGRLPTGIDRVCLAYVAHYRRRAQAVVQWGNARRILSADISASLFDLILSETPGFRAKMAKLFLLSMHQLLNAESGRGRIYLNIGHSGLDRPGLAEWFESDEIRAVFMVHDLIPITHPQYCRPGSAEKHSKRMAVMLGSSVGIIGNSQATLDIVGRYAKDIGAPHPRMLAAWLGTTPLSSSHQVPFVPPDPYFVVLGTIEGRKNHLILLQTWRLLIQKHGPTAPRLVIIGQRGWEANEAFSLLDGDDVLRTHIIELQRCSDVELAGYLRNARALLFPSFAEGYGMPLVEALSVGTPVIASDLEVFRELAPDIPDFLDPADLSAWQAIVEEYCLPASNARKAQIARMQNYEAPTWSKHFATVDRWLDNFY